jgi:hypothetical protein
MDKMPHTCQFDTCPFNEPSYSVGADDHSGLLTKWNTLVRFNNAVKDSINFGEFWRAMDDLREGKIELREAQDKMFRTLEKLQKEIHNS